MGRLNENLLLAPTAQPSPDRSPHLLIVGLGNPWRGDDGVGPWVARQLGRRLGSRPGVGILANCREPVQLLDRWNQQTTVLVIDAVRSGARPGTLWQVQWPDLAAARTRRDGARYTAPQQKPGMLGNSSHALGLVQTLALAQALDQLPARLWCYGLEIASDKFGSVLTPAVRRAARQLVRQLLVALRERETC